jgi:hypothetical protein
MVVAAIRMLPGDGEAGGDCTLPSGGINWRGCLPKSIGAGLAVGFLTGLFGVGGGFLIIPALVLLLGLPMPAAVGTHAPIGLARPAMGLACVLDPTGRPEAIWATDATRTYLTAHRTTTDGSLRRGRWFTRTERSTTRRPVTSQQAHAALLLLDRYGLATLDEQAGPSAVRVHALTARAAYETTTAEQTAAAVRTAADALLELWPDAHHDQPDLTAVLRANTHTLTACSTHAGDVLWDPDGAHFLLMHAGVSLFQAGPTQSRYRPLAARH